MYRKINDSFGLYPSRDTLEDFVKRANSYDDKFQVCFPHGYLLDLGWYPEHQENGYFIIQVIFQSAEDTPIYKSEAIDEEKLVEKINEAIALIRKECFV